MLDEVLKFFRDGINEYLVARTGSDAIKIELTRIAESSGQYAFGPGAIALSVINVEEERVLRQHHNDYNLVAGQHVVLPPPLRLNVFVLFAVHTTTHDEALKYLSHVLTYFQHRRTFTSEHFPALNPGIGKLTLDLQSLNWEQLNQLWAYLGAKYLPSAVYKISVVALQDNEPVAIQPPILTVESEPRLS